MARCHPRFAWFTRLGFPPGPFTAPQPTRRVRLRRVSAITLLALNVTAAAGDAVVSARLMSLDLAGEIAMNAVKACRARGYQVAAVVVDRSANTQVVLRDVLASRFTVEIAERKANAVILSGLSSGEFRGNRADIRPEMNSVDGILVLQGGLPIHAAGSVIGALGVSGAPGGELDEACATSAIQSVRETLEFAD